MGNFTDYYLGTFMMFVPRTYVHIFLVLKSTSLTFPKSQTPYGLHSCWHYVTPLACLESTVPIHPDHVVTGTDIVLNWRIIIESSEPDMNKVRTEQFEA